MARGWALDRYTGGVGHLVRAGKYRPERRLVRLVGRLLAGTLRDRGVVVDVVVPAPSTVWTRMSRGFAVASVLAGPVASTLGVRCVHALSVAGGARQATLEARDRRANMVGRVHARRSSRGTVLLVDDVVTTGATLGACAQALLRAGAERVVVACACLGGSGPQTPVQNP